jgi:hypothetical protein
VEKCVDERENLINKKGMNVRINVCSYAIPGPVLLVRQKLRESALVVELKLLSIVRLMMMKSFVKIFVINLSIVDNITVKVFVIQESVANVK